MTRRRLVALLATTAMLTSAGCSIDGHQIRTGSAAACAFHVWRLHHDLSTHHNLFAAFQAWRSVHNCSRVVSR
jgi:hypothetical protein